MTSPIYAAKLDAREAAEEALYAYWDEDFYPVDPFEIASRMGVDVLFGDLPDDVSGMLESDGSSTTMYIDSREPYRRQRFTAAHELGHYMQRRRRGELADVNFVDRRGDMATRGTDPEEVFANEFAANLLMPASVLKELVSRGYVSWDIARFFEVSPASMEFRLRNLGLTA